MPVIGHAFVGIVTAHGFEPGSTINPRRLHPTANATWVPTLVTLAYLPDVVSHMGLWASLDSAKVVSHSLFVGVGLGLIAGVVWARVSRGSARMLCALAVGSVLFHDVLDLLQADDRVPFWPIADVVIAPGWLAFPNRLATELLLFGGPWLLVEGWRYRLRRHARTERDGSYGATWLSTALVLTFVTTALGVEYLRWQRDMQLDEAQRLIRSGQYAAALKAADSADRWPFSAGPGRLDIVRGEAFEGLGNYALAERFYLRAYRIAPDNFWAVADLAEYYAAHGTATDRQRAAPYVDELHRRFAGHQSLRTVVERVERSVARVP